MRGDRIRDGNLVGARRGVQSGQKLRPLTDAFMEDDFLGIKQSQAGVHAGQVKKIPTGVFKDSDIVGVKSDPADEGCVEGGIDDTNIVFSQVSDAEHGFRTPWTKSPCVYEDDDSRLGWWKQIPDRDKPQDETISDDLISLPIDFLMAPYNDDDLATTRSHTDIDVDPAEAPGPSSSYSSQSSQRGPGAAGKPGQRLYGGRSGGRGRRSDEPKTGGWSMLPARVLRVVIAKLERSTLADQWPYARDVVACAGVCKRWRSITLEASCRPATSGLLTFPSSLKQPGPRAYPIQCFIRRRRSWSGRETFYLYLGLPPSSFEYGKLLMTATRRQRMTTSDYVIRLGFRKKSSSFTQLPMGVLRSNSPVLGTKFLLYEDVPISSSDWETDSLDGARGPAGGAAWPSLSSISSGRLGRGAFGRVVRGQHRWSASMDWVPAGNSAATIEYWVSPAVTRGPSRMQVAIPGHVDDRVAGGWTAAKHAAQNKAALSPVSEDVEFNAFLGKHGQLSDENQAAIIMHNRAPKWHDNLQRWCLNFGPRVVIPSSKNFQLMVPGASAKPWESEELVLQFGRVDKDLFSMDFRHPLSAFHAFAICLSTFNAKP